MEGYIYSIEQAVRFFPLAAILISVPYFYYQYKNNKAIEFKKSLLVFSFLLYLLCCYGLIILPLPSMAEVENMTGPFIDLRIFGFIEDLLSYSALSLNPATWFPAMTSSLVYIPLFNLLMLIPFGIYQRRLFNNSLLKCLGLAFILSLSFELIQLSALFGLYPHPYRLFQVDDLILNTAGALIGYLIAPAKTVKSSKAAGTKIRFSPNLRARSCAFILDIFILYMLIRLGSFLFGFSLQSGILKQYIFYLACALLYFGLLSRFLGNRTLSGLFLEQQYSTADARAPSFMALLLRQFLLFGLVLPAPAAGLWLLNSDLSVLIKIPLGTILIIAFIVVLVQIFTGNIPIYESVSGTYLAESAKIKKKGKKANPNQRASLSSSAQSRQPVRGARRGTSQGKAPLQEPERRAHR